MLFYVIDILPMAKKRRFVNLGRQYVCDMFRNRKEVKKPDNSKVN